MKNLNNKDIINILYVNPSPNIGKDLLAMEISSVKHAKRLVMVMTGRLDTNTSLQLEDEVSSVVDGSIEELVLDFSGIDYVSSAGLRVLLGAYKKMIVLGGKFKIIGVKAMVFDILEMTGMNNVFNIEKA